MKLQTITINGWGQNNGYLNNLIPASREIKYGHLNKINDFYAEFQNTKCDVLIGWSLGGQMAIRAVEKKIVSPKLLVLISTPFQFVNSKEIRCGITKSIYANFVREYNSDPINTLRKFSVMISRNDDNAKNILEELRKSEQKEENWKRWLFELGEFSCKDIDFKDFPKTLIIHGRDDSIVDVTNTSLFLSLIKDCKVEVFDGCGHAPHIHSHDKVSKIIQEYTNEL